MSRARRTFNPEFKLAAARLVLEQGHSVRQACQAIRVGETVLRRWIAQLQQEMHVITPRSKALTPDQQRIQELVARVLRLELAKSLLKKATALLMSDDVKLTRW
ncbi:transposase [Chromobacterium phragmitis]|uniref:Transposase n=1 Tax=Chromobacterium phragmitis TaxID=2202141 RepID=A0ABV0IPB2_9NEIS